MREDQSQGLGVNEVKGVNVWEIWSRVFKDIYILLMSFALYYRTVHQLDSLDHQCTFKTCFSPQLHRAAAATKAFSGQKRGDTSGHAS